MDLRCLRKNESLGLKFVLSDDGVYLALKRVGANTKPVYYLGESVNDSPF
jgi:hypothetical protein